MKNLLITILILFSPLCGSSGKSDEDLIREYRELRKASENYDVSDIDKIHMDISKQGVKSVVRLIFAHHETRFRFLDYIEQGNKRYFDVGLMFHVHTDASWSESLKMAYSHSWLANPKYILPLISDSNVLLSSYNLCPLPFWYDPASIQDEIDLNRNIIKTVERAISILTGEYGKLNSDFVEHCHPKLKKQLVKRERELERLTKLPKGAPHHGAPPI